MTTIDLSTAPVSTQAAISLGLKEGIFEKEGIDLKIHFDPTSAVAIPLMLKGERDAMVSGTATPISAVAQGLTVEFISGVAADQTTPEGSTMGVIVTADSGIKSWKELEGKTVGTNSLKCCYEFSVNKAVQKNGGDPGAIDWVAVPYANSASALEQGRVDAISTIQPFVLISELGGAKLLGDPLQEAFGIENPTMTTLSMNKSYVEEDPEVVDRFLNAVDASSEFANSHPTDTRSVIHELAEIPMDVLNKMPLPKFTTTLSKAVVEGEGEVLEESGLIDAVPSFEEVVWSEANLGQ